MTTDTDAGIHAGAVPPKQSERPVHEFSDTEIQTLLSRLAGVKELIARASRDLSGDTIKPADQYRTATILQFAANAMSNMAYMGMMLTRMEEMRKEVEAKNSAKPSEV